MKQHLIGNALLAGFLVIAVLLYRSTASYPAFVQGSTASYVRFLALALGILCAVDLASSWWTRKKGGRDEETDKPGGKVTGRFWALLALLAVYGWALGLVGFFPASIVFLPVTMLAMGARKPLSIVGTTAGILVFVHLVFVKLLEVQLPAGTLF